jgi:hypothetical protein
MEFYQANFTSIITAVVIIEAFAIAYLGYRLKSKPDCCHELEKWAKSVNSWMRGGVHNGNPYIGAHQDIKNIRAAVCNLEAENGWGGTENSALRLDCYSSTDPVGPPEPPCDFGKDCPE